MKLGKWMRHGGGAWILAAALLCLPGLAAAKDGVFKDPRRMTFPPLGEIRTPAIERQVLANGLVVYLLEDHEFPMVDYQVLVHAGSMYEPEALRGLAKLTGTVLRTGGTATIPGDELDLRLESMGASIESQIDDTQGRVTASFLTETAGPGLKLLADLVRNPAFPSDKIDLARVEARTDISARNDEPIELAIREFRKLMYGEHSPYGWYPEYATIAAITREDVVAFHHTFFHPDRMILTVYGDFAAPAMLGEIQTVFADWPASGRALPPSPPTPSQGPQGIFYARKAGVTQSTVLFGLMGTLASDPDYAALKLIDQYLGSGFSSRLVDEIRVKRGLAYAVGSSPGTGYHHPGVWAVYLMTQSESTMVAARVARQEIERIVAEPISEADLQRAKEITLNELIFDLASKRDVLRRKALYEYHGYPDDFLERYQQKVRTLTPADLLQAARRCVHPEQMAVVTVGMKEDFLEPLETLGPVTEIDITIPEPPAQVVIPPPTEGTLARGRQILESAASAHGGPALASVRSLRMKARGTLAMTGNQFPITVTQVRELPGRSYQLTSIGGMVEIVQVLDGQGGWTKTPQGVVDLSGEELAEAQQDQLREPEHFLVHWREMAWQALDPQEIDGVRCDVVHGRDAEIKNWILYFDAKSHLLRGMDFSGRGPQGPAQVSVRYADHRDTGGVRLPFSTNVKLDGQDFMTLNAEQIEMNVPVEEGLFARPK